jgi:hypothetical protein
MPERKVSPEEFDQVRKWVGNQGGEEIPDLPGAYKVNDEPLVMYGHFPVVVTWRDLVRLRFRVTRTGSGKVIYTDRQARQFEQDGINFSHPPQEGAQRS